MDKRFFLALLLTAIVIIVPPLFFPNSAARRPRTTADSTSRATARTDSAAAAAPAAPAAPAAAVSRTTVASQPTPAVAGASQPPTAAIETTTVQTRLSRYAFSSRGAVPVSVVLDSYPSRRPTSAASGGVARDRKLPSELLPAHTSLARYRLALGRDTIALDTVPLRAELKQGASGPSVVYSGTVGGRPMTLDYAIVPDSFLLHVTASVAGAP